MRLLIIYDIPNDRIRTRVADACLDYGLERIQYSAFAGALGRAHQRELELKVRRLLGRAPARVRFIPLDERLWERQQIIERRPPDHQNLQNQQNDQSADPERGEARHRGDTRRAVAPGEGHESEESDDASATGSDC